MVSIDDEHQIWLVDKFMKFPQLRLSQRKSYSPLIIPNLVTINKTCTANDITWGNELSQNHLKKAFQM